MHISMIGVKGIPHPGGIEHVVEQVGSRLVERRHQVTVYVRDHYTPRSATSYRGMRLIHLPSINTRSLDALTHTALAASHAALTGADIAHIHSIGLSIFAPLIRIRGIKTVVQSHGLDWQREKWGRFARAYLKLTDFTTVMLPNATMVVSKTMQHHYQERFGRQVVYIPNGVTRPQPVEPREIHQLGLKGHDYILFAARLVPEKGCHYLIEAYRRLQNPALKLIIAGDENYANRYTTELKRQGDENIRFLGFVKGRLLQELLSHAYLYVLPSAIEGLSTGLLEAMSYGNAVLVSDIPENCEVVGNSGSTFRSGNVDSLHAKLEAMLADEALVRRYRERASRHVAQKYNWETVVDQYEALYRTLLGAGGGAHQPAQRAHSD